MSSIRITDRTRVVAGRMFAIAAGLTAVASMVVYLALGRAGDLYDDWVLHNALIGGIGITALGWLAIARQPRNGAVWALLWSAGFQVLKAASSAGTVLAAEVAEITRPLGELTAGDLPLSVAIPYQLDEWTWVPGVFLILTLVPLLFPDGTLLSPRWRFVGWAAVVAMASTSAGLLWLNALGPGSDTPIGDDVEVPAWLGFLFLGLLAVVVASIAALIIRYRRSEGEERNQFRWVAWGAGIFATGFGITFAIDLGASGGVFQAVSLFTGSVMIAALAIAVTKYRLYEIDLVIDKTVMLAALIGIIAAVYVAIVVGAGSLFGSGDETDFGIQVAATAVVAIAFHPARRRAQHWANRIVYGERVAPYEVLARFSHRAAEASDDELLARIPRLVVDGTGAVEAVLWIRGGETFEPAATWPGAVERVPLPAGEWFEDPDADYSLPVFHGGELLGGLSLVKRRGEALPPAEERLVTDLAAGLGLALRNTRLTARLREQVADLEASRERVLAAADEARRALEHDLDSGPQQQLVALKVMLGPTRKQAEQTGARKTADVLAQLEAEAGEAIRSVREFSGGVYPPLLEAEGLPAAVAQQAQKSSLPVALDADGVGRYPREVEAAVYFTILEALQNVAKYADAASVSVTLRQDDGTLRFEVVDDGRGFDPSAVTTGSGLANMADRLDAVGGSSSVESAPGSGTTVRGTVPIDAGA